MPRHISKSIAPSWDLGIVLNGLSRDLFEPLETINLKALSYKTATVLALATAKQFGDMHAFSMHPS